MDHHSDDGMEIEITEGQTAMRQAWLTAGEYFDQAVDQIDTKFGDGYSEKHPELVAAFMSTAARDLETTCRLLGSQKIRSGLRDIAESLQSEIHRRDHPIMGETLSEGLEGLCSKFGEVAESIQNVARMVDLNGKG